MKKLMVVLFSMFLVLSCAGCGSVVAKCGDCNDYFRVHIRANSNSDIDQDIKYYVKDVVVTYLTPYLKDCTSKDDVISVVNSKLDDIKNVVDGVLCEKGFDYVCGVEINNEFFPTKSYENLTLKADYYDALIIMLGTGTGQNWWCVMYPNICFNEPTNVVYKSKIKEIIKKLKGD